jgi:hypothetical protein
VRVRGWRRACSQRKGRDPLKDTPPVNSLEDAAYPYTSVMAHEDTVLEDAMDNLKEAGHRIRAT